MRAVIVSVVAVLISASTSDAEPLKWVLFRAEVTSH